MLLLLAVVGVCGLAERMLGLGTGLLLSAGLLPRAWQALAGIRAPPTSPTVVPDLQVLVVYRLAALQGLSHGQRVPLELYTFGDRNRKKNVLLHCDWNW